MNRVAYIFSCAGGRAGNYEQWKKYTDFNIVSLEYPGHWERWKEPLSDDYQYIIDDLIKQILANNRRYAIREVFLIGHSMGALLAWMLSERLVEEGNVKGIIIMAMAAPSRLEKSVFKDSNSKNEIKEFLRSIRQVPDKTLSSSFFMSNLYPMIKNDFKLYNNLAANHKVFQKTNIPCLVLYSKDDPIIEVDDVLQWCDYCEDVTFKEMRGNHFFPYNSKVIRNVCEEISDFVNSLAE